MKKYISYFSAALYWGVPNLEILLSGDAIDKRRTGEIVDITYITHSSRCNNKRYKSHACEISLPRGSVVKCNNNHIASPELVFLQLANVLDIHSLIFLGIQMCSYPPGKPETAITTKKKLQSIIDKTPGHYGHKKAEYALSFIENGSASPMESIVFMILTLPHSLGGYGLKNACFNREIRINKVENKIECDAQISRPKLKQQQYFVDIYYEKSMLGVEYNSFAHHSRPSEQSKDQIRASELEHHGIDIMPLNTVQVYDKEACEKFARNLASRLGKRIRIRAKSFSEQQDKLRSLLPSRQR